MTTGIVDASVEVQKAAWKRLKHHSGVATIVDGRVFDEVPTGKSAPSYPYLSFGPTQVIPDKAQEYDSADIVFQVDAWSDVVGMLEVKSLGAAVRAALDEEELEIPGFRLVSLLVEDVRYLTEPNGKTKHGVLVFRARTEPIA